MRFMKILQKLNRFYTQDLEPTVAFYEKLLDKKCCFRHTFSEFKLELAQVDDILILAGSPEALLPVQGTKAVFIVDEINVFKEYFSDIGAVFIKDVKETQMGWNMIIKHPQDQYKSYVAQLHAEEFNCYNTFKYEKRKKVIF